MVLLVCASSCTLSTFHAGMSLSICAAGLESDEEPGDEEMEEAADTVAPVSTKKLKRKRVEQSDEGAAPEDGNGNINDLFRDSDDDGDSPIVAGSASKVQGANRNAQLFGDSDDE